jgi:hypothetical protein
VSVRARPEPATAQQNPSAPEKGFAPQDYAQIQLHIKKVWALLDEIDAETRHFKETMQFDRALP